MKIIHILFITLAFGACAQEKSSVEASTVSSLSFRLVGPALTSGRVSDLAIHPSNTDTWYVSTASGGLWKTQNHGITFKPIFDSYASYSIGCVEIAPQTPIQFGWVPGKTTIKDPFPTEMGCISP